MRSISGKEAQELSAAALEAVGALVVVLDRQGRIALFNRACQQATGYAFEEVEGRQVWDFLLPSEEAGAVKRRFQGLAEGDFPTVCEQHWVGKNGARRLIGWTNTAVRDGDGEIRYLIGTGVDVTERREAERALRESGERFRNLYEWTPDGYYLTDLEGVLVDANRACEHLVGYRKSELIGKNFLSAGLLSLEDTPRAIALLARNAVGQPAGPDEFRLRRQDGRQVEVELSTYPVVLGGRRLVLACARDITGRSCGQGTPRLAQEPAEAAAQMKSALLAELSREIRTPMNGVLGMASLLLDTRLEAEQHGYADAIYRCAESLLTVINDVLDCSKAEAGKLELIPVRFDLETLVRQVLELLAPEAASKGLQLSLGYAAETPRRFLGGADRIRQVLLSLAGNALKFTEQGGVRVEVSREEGDGARAWIRVAVSDTSVGIPEERMAGLGVTSSKKLVELLGGSLEAQSAARQGSTFSFRLPLLLDPEQPASARART